MPIAQSVYLHIGLALLKRITKDGQATKTTKP